VSRASKAKRASIKKRLESSIKEHSRPLEVFFRQGFGRGIRGPVPSFEKHRAWAERVRSILTFSDDDRATRKAFDAFDFDVDDPRNWGALLRVFAKILEPELDDLANGPKSAGAKLKWTFAKRVDLVLKIQGLRQNSPTKLPDHQACRRIIDPIKPMRVPEKKVVALVRQAVAGRREWRRRAKNGKAELPAFLKKGKDR
jgi:hypothetical protein